MNSVSLNDDINVTAITPSSPTLSSPSLSSMTHSHDATSAMNNNNTALSRLFSNNSSSTNASTSGASHSITIHPPPYETSPSTTAGGTSSNVNTLSPRIGELLDPKVQRFPALGDDYNEIPTYPIRPSYKEYHAQLRPASQPVVFDGCPDDPYRPASVPIYQTATFAQPSSTTYGPYDYTRSGNPTRTALERQIAMLENAHAAFAFTSGMAALTAVTRLLSNGDTIAISADIYGGMHRLVNRVTSLAGIKVVKVETWDINAVETTLQNNKSITLLHIESPSNPLMRITDIRAVANICHQNGVLLSVDSTMMTPYLQKPLNHGADVVIHSLTKFFSGTSDTMGGVVCVASEDLAKRIAFFQNAEGTGLGPFDCWLFLRSIKTLAIRVERAQQNAGHVAAFLRRHPVVTAVYYAGLDPTKEEMLANDIRAKEHKIHHGQARGGGSVISFTTGSVELSRRIIDSVRLFKLTVSFGSCNSLCEMPATLSHASIPAHERTLPDDLIRISIGIEDVNDLIDDLQQAFAEAMNSNSVIAPRTMFVAGGNPSTSSSSSNGAGNPPLMRSNSTMHTTDRTKPELPDQKINNDTTSPVVGAQQRNESRATEYDIDGNRINEVAISGTGDQQPEVLRILRARNVEQQKKKAETRNSNNSSLSNQEGFKLTGIHLLLAFSIGVIITQQIFISQRR